MITLKDVKEVIKKNDISDTEATIYKSVMNITAALYNLEKTANDSFMDKELRNQLRNMRTTGNSIVNGACK